MTHFAHLSNQVNNRCTRDHARTGCHLQRKERTAKAKIKKALKYPIAVIVVAIIATIILLVKVVPVFAELFSSLVPTCLHLHSWL